MIGEKLRAFLWPRITRNYLIRLALLAITAYLLFSQLLIPAWIRGESMHPTYRNGSLTFCWCLRYLLSSPRHGDVVMVRFAGKDVMLLKRVIAVAGETLEFRDGRLYLDGRCVPEEYVELPCNWTLAPRKVKDGHVYVAGDNRSMPIEQHQLGQTPVTRVIGGPLW